MRGLLVEGEVCCRKVMSPAREYFGGPPAVQFFGSYRDIGQYDLFHVIEVEKVYLQTNLFYRQTLKTVFTEPSELIYTIKFFKLNLSSNVSPINFLFNSFTGKFILL